MKFFDANECAISIIANADGSGYGDVEAPTGWYAPVTVRETEISNANFLREYSENEYGSVDLRTLPGFYVIRENSDGIVNTEEFSTEAEQQATADRLDSEYERWLADDADDTDADIYGAEISRAVNADLGADADYIPGDLHVSRGAKVALAIVGALVALAVYLAASASAIGTGAPVAVRPVAFEHSTVLALTVTDGPLYRVVNRCEDSEPVYVDGAGYVFGDSDFDGILSGTECDFS